MCLDIRVDFLVDFRWLLLAFHFTLKIVILYALRVWIFDCVAGFENCELSFDFQFTFSFSDEDFMYLDSCVDFHLRWG